MRRYIDIIREAMDPLDVALGQVAAYIQHNDGSDLEQAVRVLHQHGYREPTSKSRFFRALFHDITVDDHQKCNTVGELFQEMKRTIPFRMGGLQGFTMTEEEAVDFVKRTLHISYDVPPLHHANMPVADIKQIIIVYAVEAPQSSVMFSMAGLKPFLKMAPTGPGKTALEHSLFDMWEGYESDNEVVIDTTAGVRVVGMSLYDSLSSDD
jgi:hypothetical protein